MLPCCALRPVSRLVFWSAAKGEKCQRSAGGGGRATGVGATHLTPEWVAAWLQTLSLGHASCGQAAAVCRLRWGDQEQDSCPPSGRVDNAASSYATSNMTSSPEAAAETAPSHDQDGEVGEPDAVAAAAGGPCAKPLALVRFVFQFAFQHWFILGLGLFIGLAAAVPKVGGKGHGRLVLLTALWLPRRARSLSGDSPTHRWLRQGATSAQSGRSSMERCVLRVEARGRDTCPGSRS